MYRKKYSATRTCDHRSNDTEESGTEGTAVELRQDEDGQSENNEQSESPNRSATENPDDESEQEVCAKKKKSTPGVVYLSYIPKGLTVAKAREILSDFGDVGRMYFEPVKKLDRKTRPNHCFAEGWVEFKKKKVAKKVAEVLNAKPVGGKRRASYHDCLWSIKYLHRYRWTHLSERLAYEKAVKDQRLRTEIAKAKREASYYAKALERSIRMKKKRRLGEAFEENPSNIKLRKTDREIREQKPEPAPDEVADKALLLSIFSKD